MKALPGQRLDDAIGLQDPFVREAVVDGGPVSSGCDQPRRAKHRQVLAHVRDLAHDPVRQFAHGQLAIGERFEDAQALGVAKGTSDGGGPLAFGLVKLRTPDHGW